MSFRLFAFLTLLPFSTLAQTPDQIELCEYMLKGDFKRYENKLEKTKEILALAETIATAQNIRYQIETLETKTGDLSEYPALRILPQGSALANQEAARLEKEWGGLRIYFSPYDLKRSGASAFFKPDGSMIGVPFDFLLNHRSESYLHEKLHAETYRKLILKQDDTYAGSFLLLKGEKMSVRNDAGYHRHASIDEIMATRFSVEENMRALYERFRSTPREDFIKNEANEILLDTIKFNVETLIDLSEQSEDLFSEAIKKFEQNDFTVTQADLVLGDQLKASVLKVKLLVPSYERGFKSGRGFDAKVENGTEVQLLGNAMTRERLKERAAIIIHEAQKSQIKYSNALRWIGVRVEYADLTSTDIEQLYQSILK